MEKDKEKQEYDEDESAVLYSALSQKGFKYYKGFMKENLAVNERIVMFPMKQETPDDPAFVIRKSKTFVKK